jgi:hypothetical protein
LPIEGATAELHDEVPSVELAGGSPQLRGSSYIHCLKSYTINADELLTWTVAGREEVCVGEGSLTFLTKYSELLQGIKVMGLSYFRRTEMVHKFLTETGEGIGQEYYAPSQP